MTGGELLAMRGIGKSFSGVEVLRSVDFDVRAGEVHALVGQNGAGKSSLMKVLAGVYVPDSGEIVIGGTEHDFRGPADAHAAGVRMVFQEFSLVPQLSVADNVVLRRESTRGPLLDARASRQRARDAFARLGVEIDVTAEVGSLRVGDRQMVEIAKALDRDPRILVLDEPTASLARPEIERLFDVVRRLKDSGLGIVFISHHMQEIEELCDRVTVLRDGRLIAVLEGDDVRVDRVIAAMLPDGEDPALAGAPTTGRGPVTGEPVLAVSALTAAGRFADVSFEVRRGEILGLAGLLGSGTSEVLDTVFGLRAVDAGAMRLDGSAYWPGGPAEAIRTGVMLVSEDRRTSGIVTGHSVADNMLQPVWSRFARLGWLRERAAQRTVTEMVAKLRVKTTSIAQAIERLSGGNQQKVLIGRALLTTPRVLLLNEPTAGIDVAARADIAAAVREYVTAGGSAVWLSSDMQELADVCDRVLVMRRGVLVQTLSAPSEPELVAAIQQDLDAA